MDLEGDLGIDSIKRVEILAAVQDKAPGMPDVDAAVMSTLTTLGQIVDYMQGLLGGSAPAASAPTASPAAPALDLHAVMFDVVADKTGYPAEMLELTMDLEGDLGIDSIKRVEILAAVQDKAPGMPDVDAAVMSTLTTLGQIVDYMQGLLGGDDNPTPPSGPATPPTTDASSQESPAPGPVSSPSTVLADHPELGRYALHMVHTPPLGFAQSGLHGASEVLITGDGGDLAEVLATTLQERGITARATDVIPPEATAVVFLGGLREVAGADEAIATQREAYGIARTLAPGMTARGGLLITVQDTGGAFGTTDFPADRAWIGGLPALLKTASQEWPDASLKAIDIARGGQDNQRIAQLLADELLLGGGDLEVALPLSGERLCPRSVPVPVVRGAQTIQPGEVVVVSGGARGVTAACVIQWAAECQGRFLLLGRSALADEPACCAGITDDAGLKRALLGLAKASGTKLSPSELAAQVRAVLSSREIRATLDAVAATGAEARYRAVDVTRPEAVAGVLTETRNDWGPIRALVHGAGVLADRLIADQTDEQFDRVFNTKIEGLRTLFTCLNEDPLRLICMFSSVSARCGNNGQSTYAMANEILNKVAWAESARRGEDVLVKSLGWGPWEGGMVGPELKAHFATLGVPMIPLHIGAQMLADELSGAHPDQIELVLGGEPRPEALLVVGSKGRVAQLEVLVNQSSHPYLSGHSVEGEVVVPVVLVLEWFSRMARSFRPDLTLQSINELKVLKGILVEDFAGNGERFVLSCSQKSNGQGALLEVALHSPDGSPRYSALAQMVEGDRKNLVSNRGEGDLALSDWGGAPIYGDVLFHTDLFQVIRDIGGVSDSGISGTLSGVEQAEWTWESWNTDVAALDGGLQMLLLWAREQLGGAALPMGINQTIVHSATPPNGPVRCVARCRPDGANRGVADVIFENEEGQPFTEFRGVELVLRPASNKN